MAAVVDVTDESQVRDTIKNAVKKWGHINCAVNCAGIAPPMRTLSKKGPHNLAQFAKVLQVNTGDCPVLILPRLVPLITRCGSWNIQRH